MAAKPQKKSSGSMKRKSNPDQKSEGPVSNFKKPKFSSNPKKPKFNPSNAQNKAGKQPSSFPKKEYKNPNVEKGEGEDSKKLARLRSKVRPF